MNHTLQIPEKIFYKSFIKRHGIDKCFCKNKNVDTSTQVVLYLDYPKFIHLGDMLWLEPVARLLASNFSLAVCCNRSMEFYFRRLGYKVIDKTSIDDNALLIARTELAYPLRGRNVLWINFNYINVSMPIINAVLKNIAEYLGLPEAHDAKPRVLNFSPDEQKAAAKKFGMESKNRYVIFNNYIDSRKWGMRKSAFRQADQTLRGFAARHKSDNNIKLIHTGTAKNKEDDPSGQWIADLDLRGMTGVEECFALASLENVMTYIGFDAFWLHLFNIYDKSSHIMLRSGFSEKWKRQVKNYVAVPYLTKENRVRFIV